MIFIIHDSYTVKILTTKTCRAIYWLVTDLLHSSIKLEVAQSKQRFSHLIYYI